MSKRSRRRKRAKRKQARKISLPAFLASMYERREKKLSISLEAALKSLPDILRTYSVSDITYGLFVSSMWLPNISAGIKHQLLLYVFASMGQESFSQENRICSYSDFEHFLKQIYPLLPTFDMLEDYIPEPDWGQVKFFHDEQIYKIFYGQELSNVYDRLILFQMLYVHFNAEYQEVSGRSPAEELRSCLRYQDEIISGISSQIPIEASKISPGHIEMPSKNFWENASDFYAKFRAELHFEQGVLDNFSVEIGKLPREFMDPTKFIDLVHRGKIVPYLFVRHKGQYLPVLPRRCSSILIDSWAQIYEANHEKVTRNSKPQSISIGVQLFRYVEARIRSDFLRPFVSALLPEGSPHEMLFSMAFISKDKLILVYVASPAYARAQIEKELEDLAPKISGAIERLISSPVTLALHAEKKNVRFESKSDAQLKPELFVVVPSVSTELFSFSMPEPLVGAVISMDQFLGIIDELDKVDTLASFIEYRDDIGDRIRAPFISPLDVYGSFKSSLGTLVEGALEYDFISLDPNWGSNMRYETLSEFWKSYPEKHFFDHPRSWKVIKETKTRVRLEARGYFGAALYCKIGETHIFLNAPFDRMTYEQGLLANLLMECLEDALSQNALAVEKHHFLRVYDQIQVLFFPSSLVKGNDDFKHLLHLIPTNGYWQSDSGRLGKTFYGIRLVFNDELLAKDLMEVKDCSIEIGLLTEILERFDEIARDPGMKSLVEMLESQKSNRPRFKMFAIKKKASFPEFVKSHIPSMSHFKRARKRIAEIARLCGLTKGSYKVDDAKRKLNAMRDAIVLDVDSEVKKYDYARSIPYLLTRIDALADDYERKKATVEYSKEHEVDFDRAQAYAEDHSNFVPMHRNYRYLIEKFVQLQPSGGASLNKDEFQYLIAIIDWLHVFYSASDMLHYDIGPVGMKVDRNFLVDVEYEGDMKVKQMQLGEEEAKISLGLIGRAEDKVESGRPIHELMGDIDRAFYAEFGFAFSKVIQVLHVLAAWPEQIKGKEVAPFYCATLSEIQDTCGPIIEGITKGEIAGIVDFLTLKPDQVLRVIGQADPCLDLPVWEHRKRYARYTLRPLILIGDKYFWGPYSAMKSGIIWSGNLSYGTLPIDLQSPKVQEVVESEKELIEDAIVEKSYDIIKTYSKYVVKNCDLHDVNTFYPAELGDFDILAYLSEKNVILNIECKDILPVFCLKDAKRLREKIFGRPGKDQGHFEHIDRRQKYLTENVRQIAKDLSWPLAGDAVPKIVTIYLTRLTYWWTRFPPREINASFLRVDMLANFIQDL